MNTARFLGLALMMGFAGTLTAQSLDHLIMTFGIHIENKLMEVDPLTQRPRYTLKQLLEEPIKTAEQVNRDSFMALQMLFGRRPPAEAG